MQMRSLAAALLGAAVLAGSPCPVRATYHIMVIRAVFGGFEQAPGAQYVILRTQADLQTFVHGQALSTFDAAGNVAGDFAAFCSTLTGSQCDLPNVSPACADGGCPSSFEGNDSFILVATPWARDLFCVTPDLLATGFLPYPDGRVCFGNVRLFAGSCLATGPVDCVAYGEFAGDNGIFGDPAPALVHGVTLSSDPTRPSQCHGAGLSATALCVLGANANAPCSGDGDCPGGTCRPCPDPNCGAQLTSARGFFYTVPPTMVNFRGSRADLGVTLGDSTGDGRLGVDDIEATTGLIFAAGKRCSASPQQRGVDVNLDTQVNAADLVATIQLLVAG
jgi:hypothetical protein